MEKAFTEMDIDEWELLHNKNSHTIVQEQVFPSQTMEEEEEEQSLGRNIKQKDLTPIQPNFQATVVEPYDEVVEEEVIEEEKDQISNHDKQSDDNEEGEAADEQATIFDMAVADIASEGKSESISFTEEDDEEDDEEEEVGEMVEYTGPESKEKSACNAFRLRNLLRSAGLAAVTFSIFILQKSSMHKNQKIQLKISKNEKAKQLFQQQQEASEPLPATAHSSFSGHYDEWY